MHIPVLLNEVINGLKLERGKTIVDGTMNGGGHAREIIRHIMPGGTFLGVELDKNVCDRTREQLHNEYQSHQKAIVCEWDNYKNITKIIHAHGITAVDGVLLDLGFSSLTLEESQRGFSFQKDEILDMRYDQSSGLPLWHLLSRVDEKTLANKIFEYGEERYSRSIARAILQARKTESISRTKRLAEIIRSAVPSAYRKGKIHPATKTFQAMRIWVNQELDNLQILLDELPNVLTIGSRVAIISFHSLEDRIVKQWCAQIKNAYEAHIITKKPTIADEREQKENPRSRSAKLRIVEWGTKKQYEKKQKYFKQI